MQSLSDMRGPPTTAVYPFDIVPLAEFADPNANITQISHVSATIKRAKRNCRRGKQPPTLMMFKRPQNDLGAACINIYGVKPKAYSALRNGGGRLNDDCDSNGGKIGSLPTSLTLHQESDHLISPRLLYFAASLVSIEMKVFSGRAGSIFMSATHTDII